MTPRHVGINAVFLRPQMAGIETYVRRLVPELIALRPDVRFSLFVSAHGREMLRDAPWAAELELVTHPLLGLRYLQAASEMTLLAVLARRRRLDVVHSVAMTGPLGGVPHLVTVGDVMWMREPRSVDRATGWTWRTFVPRIARRADRVITYSHASRSDVVDLLGVPASRIDVVPLGPGSEVVADPVPEDELRRRHDLHGRTIVLAASGKRPTKNLARLIAAFPRVLEHDPRAVLVLPGARTVHEAELRSLARRLGTDDQIRFLDYVEPSELEGLYRAAACFVFPSLQEGFGLPILEAMRRGVPVACSRATSIPEVAGDAARYFNPMAPRDIAEAVIDLLTNGQLRDRLVDAGRQRSALFSWRTTAVGTFESMERALAAHRARSE